MWIYKMIRFHIKQKRRVLSFKSHHHHHHLHHRHHPLNQYHDHHHCHHHHHVTLVLEKESEGVQGLHQLGSSCAKSCACNQADDWQDPCWPKNPIILVIQKAPASHPGLSCVPSRTTTTNIDVVSREKLPLHRTCRPWRQPRSWTFVIFNVCTFLLEPSLEETATWQVVEGGGQLSWGGQLLEGSAHLRGDRWFVWYCAGFIMY